VSDRRTLLATFVPSSSLGNKIRHFTGGGIVYLPRGVLDPPDGFPVHPDGNFDIEPAGIVISGRSYEFALYRALIGHEPKAVSAEVQDGMLLPVGAVDRKRTTGACVLSQTGWV